jgi:hypothetical protein
MLTTIIYVLGALSLHFSDISSQHAFFSLLLPLFNILFFIFLFWQLIFYFSLSSFSNDDSLHFFDLLYKFWHLDEDIKQYGFFPAVLNIVMLSVDAASLFIVIFYYIELFLDFTRI